MKSLPLTTAILDGEIVMVDAQDHSSFQKLQRAMSKSATSAFVYEVFDLIYLDGYDLTGVPLTERKRLLKDLCAASRGTIRLLASSHRTFTRRHFLIGRVQLVSWDAVVLEGEGAPYKECHIHLESRMLSPHSSAR